MDTHWHPVVKVFSRIVLALCLAVPVPLAAQATPEASPPVSLAEGYVVGPGDVLEVSVLGREDYRARVQVQSDGTIQLPLINNVQAAGLTVLQLREQVRSALDAGGFYVSPAVAVQVVTYSSRYVIVLGEVASPGILPVDRAYQMSEILARVGGTRATAGEELTVRRANGEELKVNIVDAATGGPEKDPVVEPGDKIYVAVAPTFYIYGQVNAPGSYKIERDMSLRMALARSGGLTTLGSEKRIRVYRNGTELRRFEPEDKVQEGDVIVVGERFF